MQEQQLGWMKHAEYPDLPIQTPAHARRQEQKVRLRFIRVATHNNQEHECFKAS
jgi:hypothetical protein